MQGVLGLGLRLACLTHFLPHVRLWLVHLSLLNMPIIVHMEATYWSTHEACLGG